MTLAAGTRLGPYEIVVLIGGDGMGQVYRARDTRLGRDVAIKVSDERFSDRFAREAQSIAALNHPNICTLHDVGPNYLVMELIEGRTLAERLEQRAVASDEASEIGRQVASALAEAHHRGVLHRDVKPGNIMLVERRPSGEPRWSRCSTWVWPKHRPTWRQSRPKETARRAIGRLQTESKSTMKSCSANRSSVERGSRLS